MNDDFSQVDHLEAAPQAAHGENCRNVSHSVALDDLPPAQAIAIRELVAGQPATRAAAAAGVHRGTLYRWLKEDCKFLAAYNAARREWLEAREAKMMLLGDHAIHCVARAMLDGNGHVGVQVLRGLGLLPGHPPHIGSDEATQLAADRAHQVAIEKLLALADQPTG